MAVAWNRFEIAIILSLLMFTLALVGRLKQRLWHNRSMTDRNRPETRLLAGDMITLLSSWIYRV